MLDQAGRRRGHGAATGEAVVVNEIWKPVVGFEGLYEVSDLGRVRSLGRISYRRNRWGPMEYTCKSCILKPTIVRDRFQVSMHGTKGQVSRKVAHLVAEAFIGKRPPHKHVCHNDGNSFNDSASNIRYDTPLENNLDKYSHGTMPIGEGHHAARLTDDVVIFIRKCNISDRKLAKILGVSKSTVRSARIGETWRHIF